ncbi:hypothetical protein [Bradyrhizobium sp. 2TAF24]|uniref:hypothetical protein n=1 Tax=Bradyrhizobium sp. 2TAF24 TaxID=3233011 RepID=UPI003F90C3F0
MSSEKVARLLVNFDPPEPPKARSRVVPFDHAQHIAAKVQPKPEVASNEDEAYQRGKSEGYAAALAESEQKLADEKARLSAELAAERQSLIDEAAAAIARGLADASAQLETQIAGVTARILAPFIAGEAQKQAVAAFVEHLSSMVSDVRHPLLRITGPVALLDVVRSKLTARSIVADLRVGSSAEVSVIVDQVVLETQITRWAEHLKLAVPA